MIIDAFLFHQEYEMLDFRLKLLYPYVDKFIIVEADKTFSGLDKPFNFEQHRQQYAWAEDKIIYFKLHCDTSSLNLKDKPAEFQPSHDCWQIEYAQRGAIVAACNHFLDEDILIMGDVDEIPSLEAIEWAKLNSRKLPVGCQQYFFYYDLRHLRQDTWCGSIFSTLRTARSLGTQELRNRRGILTRIANAGWHLSYFNDADKIREKIESFSHQELNVSEYKDIEYIERCRATGMDLFKRDTETVKVPPDFFPLPFKELVPSHWWGRDVNVNENTSKKAKVSLTMIVRNEEHNLPNCLESVSGLFDEIVIVDTGSTDHTKEIALKFGAKIIDFTWIDDFAAARNVALENATGDYAFWLDADDVIELSHKEKLKDLLDTLHPSKKEAYILRCFCSTSTGGNIAVDHPRLFPLLADIRWERRIHEVINMALHRAGIPSIWTDIVIRHTGYIDPVVHEQKRQRNFVLLQRELAERPDDPFVYYYLGTLAFERDKWQEALGYFIIGLSKWGARESISCKLFAMIAWANQLLHRYDESLRVANEGLTNFPADGELLFRKAIALRYLQRPNEAEACFTRILSLGQPKKFYSVEPGIFGHLTRGNLALIAKERGDHALAQTHWQAVLAERPDDFNAMKHLIRETG